ncbi:hypothetical protein ABZT17_09800 [Streptomyces sp. NPDC005648]|uniref:hypothetical protein n=1 Tax=Streptomyces sp. NPDC005648 TaxID=3157044 RepID=UPI0033B93593
MALAVTLKSRDAIPGTVAYQVWSYQVSGTPGELPKDQRIALGLPTDIDVRDPSEYPTVAALAGTFVEDDPNGIRQYVGRTVGTAGSAVIAFVAPSTDATCEAILVKAPTGQAWVALPFTTLGSSPSHVQVLPAPRRGPAVFNGRPLSDFRGTLPYASEVVGVYQPLVGWLGALSTMRAAERGGGQPVPSREAFSSDAASTLDDGTFAALAEQAQAVAGSVSPIGMVNLFRQYFFEFDSFLGTPAGHLWLSPGGTVELVETSTRRTLVEKTAELSEETTRQTEETLSSQDDVADAVKESNANNTKLGVSATGGVNAPIYHAEASANFSTDSTVSKSSEETHKRSRTQSAKVSSQIKRNFKTTFKTVTETTDTSSRRYVVQNTTANLVNYELRRKMRKVGVQIQHIGSRLCWQVYLDDPGASLGLGELVHVVTAPDVTGIKKPEPPPVPQAKVVEFTGQFPILKYPGTKDGPDEDNADFVFLEGPPHDPPFQPDEPKGLMSYDRAHHIIAEAPFTAGPPAPGYSLAMAAVKSAQSGGKPCKFVAQECKVENAAAGQFRVTAKSLNVGDMNVIDLTFTLTWNPPATAQDPAQAQYLADLDAYEEQVGRIQREAYANAVRERLKLVSSVRPRSADDLRTEERHRVYRQLLDKITPLFDDPHFNAEMLAQTFDVDEMLYFVAPDYWKPHPDPGDISGNSISRNPVPRPPWVPQLPEPGTCWVDQIAGETVSGWYTRTGKSPDPERQPQPSSEAAAAADLCDAHPEWRLNYLITEETLPAPVGSSLGWRIQIDGDPRRNEFLNAAWVKAVFPVRPGHELQAIQWLDSTIEGHAALGRPYPFNPSTDPPEYQNKSVGEVLKLLAQKLAVTNTDPTRTVAQEKVFETGFDPLAGGFQPAQPYQIFDQWVEVLPTDQIVAVPVSYDPKTGQQL